MFNYNSVILISILYNTSVRKAGDIISSKKFLVLIWCHLQHLSGLLCEVNFSIMCSPTDHKHGSSHEEIEHVQDKLPEYNEGGKLIRKF
jgi:hypothetical protein